MTVTEVEYRADPGEVNVVLVSDPSPIPPKAADP